MGYFIAIVVGLLIVCVLLRSAFNRVAGILRDKAARDALSDFDFHKEKEGIKSIVNRYVPQAYRCPKCNGMLLFKEGIYGKFLGCNHYPDCDFFSLVKENEKIKAVTVLDVHKLYISSRCPKCQGVLVLRDGIYGKFFGCSRYPECRYTRSI